MKTMKLKLLGTEIYISFIFTAIIAFLLATDKTGLMLPTLFAVVMHEAGHLFAMWICDCAPKQVKLIPAGVKITRGITHCYRNDIFISLMGPVTNLVLFFTLYLNFVVYKNETTLIFALLNLLIFCFNSLPVSGLDGGIVLSSILSKKFGPDRAALTVTVIGLILAALLCIAAITLTIRGSTNISLYIMALYLIITALIKI